MPKLQHPFAEVIVLLTCSTRSHGPQPFKPFKRIQRIVLPRPQPFKPIQRIVLLIYTVLGGRPKPSREVSSQTSSLLRRL